MKPPPLTTPFSFALPPPRGELLSAVSVALCLGSQKLSPQSRSLSLRAQKNQPHWLAPSISGSAVLAATLLFFTWLALLSPLLPSRDHSNSK